MTIIFLTGQYLPKPGATGVCINNIAKECVVNGYNVKVVCYGGSTMSDKENGIDLVRVKPPSYIYCEKEQSGIGQKWDLFNSRLHKLIHLRSYPLRSMGLVRSYVRAVKTIIDQCDDEIVLVASYTPLEAVIAGCKIKREYPRVKAIYYCADTLSNELGDSGFLSAAKRKKLGYKWEEKLFDVYDIVCIMECHRDHYFGGAFSRYTDKMCVCNFPLLNEPQNSNIYTAGDFKRVVYAGTLYKELRNPEYTCKVLSEVAQHIDIDITFLGGGDCDDILREYEDKSQGKIKALGMRPYEEAQKHISQADILLSIGNKKSPMAPSKIFEYISTGKPILHFYSWEKDPCLPVLERYGNSLMISEEEEINQKMIDKVECFLSNSVKLSFNEVERLFVSATPKYTVDAIIKQFGSIQSI